jgi:hypothetical protein
MKTETQIGFKVSITINCETDQEIMAHLWVIAAQFRKHLKKHGEIPDGETVEFNDDNCYGTHEVLIEPDLYENTNH